LFSRKELGFGLLGLVIFALVYIGAFALYQSSGTDKQTAFYAEAGAETNFVAVDATVIAADQVKDTMTLRLAFTLRANFTACSTSTRLKIL